VTDDVRAAVEFDEEVFAVMCSEPLTLLCTSSGTGIATVHGDDRNDRERTAHWLADRLNGEAARTAAAVAAAREEQRAEDMLSLGREEQSSWAAFRIKAAPLTATPLADELRDEREVSQSLREQLIAAEAERDEWRRQLRDAERYAAEQEMAYADLTAELAMVRAAGKELTLEFEGVEAERDALRAQVAAETNLYKASMAEASRAIEGLTAQVEAVEAERDALRAQVAEAVERLDEFGSQATLADGIQAMRLRLVKLRAQVEAARAKTKEEEARRVELLLLTPCASEDYKEGVRQAAAKIRSERTFTTLDAMDGAKP